MFTLAVAVALGTRGLAIAAVAARHGGREQAVLAAGVPAAPPPAPAPAAGGATPPLRQCRSRLCDPVCLSSAWRATVAPGGALAPGHPACVAWPACGVLARDMADGAVRDAAAQYLRVSLCVAIDCCSQWEQPWVAALDKRVYGGAFPASRMRPRSCSMPLPADQAAGRCAACRALLDGAVVVAPDAAACGALPAGSRADCAHVGQVVAAVAGNATVNAPGHLCAAMGCCTLAQLRQAGSARGGGGGGGGGGLDENGNVVVAQRSAGVEGDAVGAEEDALADWLDR
jgi:hypothetical protein